jgi:MATE family multidrug resistance protein
MAAQYVIPPITLAFVGRLGPVALGAVTLANSCLNAGAYSAIIGLCGALDTVLSQIYGKSPHDPQYGIVTLRVGFVLMWAMVPSGALLAYLDVILLAAGMDPDVVAATVTFSRVQLFGLPSLVVLEVTRRYLQYQNCTHPVTVMQFGAVAVHALLQYVAVVVLDTGLVGSAAAWVLLITLMDVALLGYIWANWARFEATFPRLCPAAVREWGSVLHEGLPAYGMTVVEWSAFEMSNVASGFLGTVDLAAYSIVLTTYIVFWTLCNGFFFAGSFFAGEHVGAGTPSLGRKMVKVVLALDMGAVAINIAVMVTFGRQLAQLYTDDEAVISRSTQVFMYAALFHVGDGVQSCFIGIAKGIGMQMRGALIMVVTWVVVGAPLNYLFAFHLGMGAPGLYLGFFLATMIVSLPSFTYSVFIATRWEDLKPVDAASA